MEAKGQENHFQARARMAEDGWLVNRKKKHTEHLQGRARAKDGEK